MINDKTAKKLHDEIVNAVFILEYSGIPISTTLKKNVFKYNGYVKTQMLRIAKLGPIESEKMVRIYLETWDEYNK